MLICKRGSLHQGLINSFSQGFQCTIIALVALIVFSQNRHVGQCGSSWSTRCIDDTVLAGSRLYDTIILSSDNPVPRYLAHNEVPEIVDLWDTLFTIGVHEGLFYGIVGEEGNLDAHSVSVQVAFQNALHISNTLLFTANSLTVSIFTNQDSYFLFDSHARDFQGRPDNHGSAIVMQFESIGDLMNYILSLYRNQYFNLSPIQISPITQHSRDRSSPLPDGSNNMVHPAIINEPTFAIPSVQNHNVPVSPAHQTRGDFNASEPENSGGIHIDHCSNDFGLFNHTFINHSYAEENNNRQMTSENCTNARHENNPGCFNVYDQHVLHSSILCVNRNHSYTQLNSTSKRKRNYRNSNDYFKDIQAQPKHSCCCCQKFLFQHQVAHLKQSSNTSVAMNISVLDELCSSCFKDIKAEHIPRLSVSFNLLDNGLIPDELHCLNKVEKRLIALIQVFMTIVQLPGGQFAERGSVVNFISPYINIAKQLPVADQMIIVKFTDGCPSIQNTNHYVSSQKIHNALSWLKINNDLYKDILITEIGSNTSTTFNTNDISDEYCAVPTNYTVPNVNISQVANEYRTVFLRKIQSAPVSPYQLENGEEMSFPWLFPYGQNGYLSQRPMKITLREYFQTRINNFKGFFRKDIPSLLNSVNVCDFNQLTSNVSIHMIMRKPHQNQEQVRAKDVLDLTNNPDLLQNSYMFMKNIRGTVAYWKNALTDLLAMLKTLGPPTLFITLSANDLHWPELVMTLTGCSSENVADYIHMLPELVKQDPYLTALHFERRYKALFKHVLKSGHKPLGDIVDYFVRVEFQNRGSPHYHLFYWIKDVPIVTNSSTAMQLVQYINKTISTCLPDRNSDENFFNLVKQLQTHRHSDYCMKRRRSCRFGFPFAPVVSTHLLTHSNVSMHCKMYATKRTENDAYINSYNPTILQFFQSNMDIQIVNNAESAAYYICAYLCKAEPDELKAEFSKLIISFMESEQSLTLHARLLKIGTCVLKNRRMSAQEAAFRMSKLKLIQSSRNVVYVNCRLTSKRMKILKPFAERSCLPDNSTDIFHTNMIDYYYDRPIILEKMSLYEFVSQFQACPNSDAKRNGLPRYKLQTYNKWIRQKRVKNVIRTPRFPLNTDDYYFSLLMLLLPHRTESDLISPYADPKEALINKRPMLDQSFNASSSFVIDQLEQAVRMLRITQAEISDTFGLSSLSDCHLQENETVSDFTVPLIHTLPDVHVRTPDLHTDVCNNNTNDAHLHSLLTTDTSETDLLSNINMLTDDQRKVFDYVKSNFKSSSRGNQLFVTGGAGVGKSFLLSVLANYLTLTTPIRAGIAPVLRTAPTGTAARNIRGQTLHSAVYLPIDNKFSHQNHGISAKALQTLRHKYACIHTLIIDEISMVSARTLDILHERLSQISNSNAAFGNFNIIAFGDFFQLRPVIGQFAFENVLLWASFKTFVLTQNMRQLSNETFVHLLNRARIGVLNDKDISVLQTKLTLQTSNVQHHDNGTLHLFPKRKTANDLNSVMLSSLGEQCINIQATHFYSCDDFSPSDDFNNSHIPDDDRDAGGLLNILTLSVGSRVMLLRNIFTSEGLVNGALGTIQTIQCAEASSPSIIFVRFDDNTIGQMLQQPAHRNAIAIEQIEIVYNYRGRCIVRKQFPICLAWGVTIHKAQGASLDRVFCDIGNDVFAHGMSYVALSRVRTLEGLHLYSFSPIKVTANPKVLAYYQQLNNM